MLIAHRSWRDQSRASSGMPSLLQVSSAPLVAITALFVSCLAFGQSVDGAYMILALLLFALTFPGPIPPAGTRRLALAADVLAHWLMVAALLFMLGWITHTLHLFDQRVILAWVTVTPVALIGLQLLFPLALRKYMAAEGTQRVAIIAGGGELAHALAERIGQSPHAGIRVAGYFDDRAPSRVGEVRSPSLLGGLDEVAGYAKRQRVDLIYINMPMTSQPRILNLLDQLRDTTASIYFVPDIFVFDLIQARMDVVGGIPVLAVCETPFYGIDGVVKRLSDLVLAGLILVLISPLLLAIAIAIKLDSPGPVLFKQRRYGLDGREIVVYKFRSMTVCEDGAEIRQATQNDSRVTRLGRFLRGNSLDELPQFINVLQGRMSVVGPRPHAVAHNELYRKLISGYMIRHKVKPGITGWAQINGARGETDSLDKMRARIDYDLAYLRNWSLRLDLLIVLKTVFVVWRKQNAY